MLSIWLTMPSLGAMMVARRRSSCRLIDLGLRRLHPRMVFRRDVGIAVQVRENALDVLLHAGRPGPARRCTELRASS